MIWPSYAAAITTHYRRQNNAVDLAALRWDSCSILAPA
jgi:hypothetical protein